MDITEHLFTGVPDVHEFIARVARVVGGKVDGNLITASFRLNDDTPDDIRASKAKLKEIELQLRHLRTEIVAAVKRLNANVASLKLVVGELSPELTSAVRTCQLGLRKSYDSVKQSIDTLLLQLSTARQSIR
jgi:hypothetical protein